MSKFGVGRCRTNARAKGLLRAKFNNSADEKKEGKLRPC
jgi:hypothetical protein